MFRMCRLHPRRQPQPAQSQSQSQSQSQPPSPTPTSLPTSPPSPPPTPLPPRLPPPPPPKDTNTKSCPHLPAALTQPSPSPLPQPSLLRRGSLPVPKLPPLDLDSLPSPCQPAPQSTPRRHIHAISTSLSRFRPYLYIASDPVARDLPALRRAHVSHVVNLAGKHSPNYHPSLRYLRLHVADHAAAAPALAACFPLILAFVDRARRAGTAAVIHCTQGISRSVTAALAYVMITDGLPLDDAMRDMRLCRPIAAPNHAFYALLRRLERALRHGRPADALLLVRPHAPAHHDSHASPLLVALPASHAPAPHDVYILHRRLRQGVVVWYAQPPPDTALAAAVQIAERIAVQERLDHHRFAGPEPHPVQVAAKGHHPALDAEIAALCHAKDA